MFSRDSHKTASWVIDIEVIGPVQDRIFFARPLQLCNVILRDNCFMRFVGLPVHGDSQIPSFLTFYVKSVQSALSNLKRPPERLQSQCNCRPFITLTAS